MERNRLHAVLDEDLVSLLKSLGLLEALQDGELFCASCNTLITPENFQVLVPRRDGGFTLLCENTDCVATLAQNDDGDD